MPQKRELTVGKEVWTGDPSPEPEVGRVRDRSHVWLGLEAMVDPPIQASFPLQEAGMSSWHEPKSWHHGAPGRQDGALEVGLVSFGWS